MDFSAGIEHFLVVFQQILGGLDLLVKPYVWASDPS